MFFLLDLLVSFSIFTLVTYVLRNYQLVWPPGILPTSSILVLFLSWMYCATFSNILYEASSIRLIPNFCPLFLFSWFLTQIAVFACVSFIDSAVREGYSDDGVGLQAFSHQDEWR